MGSPLNDPDPEACRYAWRPMLSAMAVAGTDEDRTLTPLRALRGIDPAIEANRGRGGEGETGDGILKA